LRSNLWQSAQWLSVRDAMLVGVMGILPRHRSAEEPKKLRPPIRGFFFAFTP